jgi:hypothetical protein
VSIIEREPEVVESGQEPIPAAEDGQAGVGGSDSAPERPCAECGAPLEPDQDWCLECGTAQPDRPGVRTGWQGAAAVLIACGVLVSGAAAAAYAGLSSDAKKAAAPNAQAALPPQPAAPAPAPPAQTTPPAATTPPPATTAPKTPPPAAKTPTPTPPASTATPKPAATPAPTTSTKPATTTPKAPSTTQTTPKKPSPGPLTAVKLEPDAAQTYNPYARPDTDFTDAKLALDGDKATAWTAAFNGGDALVGVVLDLGKSQGVRALQLVTSTPGMTVEIYGARGAKPPVSIQDPKWDHVATQLDVAKDGRIRLGDGTDKYRWVLAWPTEGPADGGTQIAISELKVYD